MNEQSIAPMWVTVIVLSVCVPVVLYLITFSAWGREGIRAGGIDSANILSALTALAVPVVGAILWAVFRKKRRIIRRISIACLMCSVLGFAIAAALMAVSV
ncbi:DUF2568 domain-containing protein [Microbacterium luticocti]|uniref:DUF2568 domain-containing protein n=1 Tax=Microbacterium luticocti TaxID=451764 RepID=UPI0012EC18E0|nr:DUF2568 domain-containing protein [Microbacterium luticocti]